MTLGRPPYRVHRTTLSQGLRLCTVEAPYLHTASVVLYAGVGSRHETKESNGLSHFVEHMLFRGSKGYPDSYRLNLAIEQLGGTLYAETGRDYSLFQIGLHPNEVGGGLEILGDLMSAPQFRDIELERQIIVEEILEDFDERGRNVNLGDISRQEVWQDHPLGYPIAGPLENVKGFQVGHIRRHFRRFYGARNMVLAVAGPVKHARVEKMAEAAFTRLPEGKEGSPKSPRVTQEGPRFRWVHSDAAQTQIHVLFHAVPEPDPDYPALMALVRVLDDGMSTRLHYRICDQKGLAYYVSANLESLHDATLFELEAACAHAKLPDLLTESFALLRDFRHQPVTALELEKAKLRYKSELEASYDDVDALCGWFGGTQLFGEARTHAERLERMARVRAEDIQRVAQRVFQPQNLTVAVVGGLQKRQAQKVEKLVKAFR